MAMPNSFEIVIREDTPGNVVVGVVAEYQVSDMLQAFEFVRGAGATFAAVVEGTVHAQLWTAIDVLDASKQVEIPAIYNRIRVRVTTLGALGTGHKLFYSGKS